jgi:hypothetical protein
MDRRWIVILAFSFSSSPQAWHWPPDPPQEHRCKLPKGAGVKDRVGVPPGFIAI